MHTRKVLMLFVSLAALVSLGACTKVSYRPLDASARYAQTSDVKMYRTYPEVSYEEIGTIRAVGPNQDKLLKSIREKAMKVGAQAIVVKPVAKRSNSYEAQRLSKDLSKEEYIMEAIAIRFITKEK